MDMSGKTVIVAGLGVSGQSMMEVLGSRAEKVLGVDEKKPDADLHSFDRIDWDHVDLVMTSPVFNPRTPFILEAQRRGIPVMSEVELAWQLRVNCDSTGEPAQWIGITGTNGKTSTTEMTSEMLTACDLTAPAVGNIGKAAEHGAHFVCPVHVGLFAHVRLYGVKDNQPRSVLRNCFLYALIGEGKFPLGFINHKYAVKVGFCFHQAGLDGIA